MIRLVEVSSDTNIGGAGKCILTLAKMYDRKDFDMTVVLPEKSLLKPELEKLGVSVAEIGAAADKSLDFGAISKFKSIFSELKPDIVHTHASMSARIAAKLVGIKVVYTRHSVFEPPAAISRGPGRIINGMVNNMTADAIIAVAEAAKENLIKTGVSPKKISVILNGVEGLAKLPEADKPDIYARFGLNSESRVISIIARLEDIKGHDYFIEAADILLKKGINAVFVIAGTGGYAEHLKTKVKNMGLDGSIIFTGFLDDVCALMNITDIQVNASFGTEATSLALLEGMSIGIPAVVSDFGGNSGVISDGVNGYVVPAKNSAALADGICRILENSSLYKEMSDNALRIFNEKFTAAVMTENTQNLYRRLVNK